MLQVIKGIDSRVSGLFADDPVRPEISAEFRCNWPYSCVFVLGQVSEPLAVLCCSFKESVPSSMDQLLYSSSVGSNAIFYSVWSYNRGSGRSVIKLAQDWIRKNCSVTGFYTYSPVGQQVRNFHLGLGASVFRENFDSINYSYDFSKVCS